MKKLDIMNANDPVAPGEVCKWQIIDGKVQKVEEFIPPALVIEKEEKKKVEEVVKEIEEYKKKKPLFKISKWRKK